MRCCLHSQIVWRIIPLVSQFVQAGKRGIMSACAILPESICEIRVTLALKGCLTIITKELYIFLILTNVRTIFTKHKGVLCYAT